MDDAAEAGGTSLWQRVVNTCANSIRVFFSAELAFIYVLLPGKGKGLEASEAADRVRKRRLHV